MFASEILRRGAGGVIEESEDEALPVEDRRDYDVEHYARLLRKTFAVRLARAFTPEDYEAVFADPDQMPLFAPPVSGTQTVLTNQ